MEEGEIVWRTQRGINNKNNIQYDDTSGFISEGHVYAKSEGLHLQGMINIINNTEDDGGFVCVPKFNFDQWYDYKKKTDYDNMIKDTGKYSFVESDMKYIYEMKRITAKAGSLIIWNRTMAHTGKPNNSSRPRLGIPISWSPKTSIPNDKRKERQNILKKHIKDNDVVVTDIGHDIFDLTDIRNFVW